MSIKSINNLESLIRNIYLYEPEIINKILNYIFIPCNKYNKKYKYILALPKLGTNFIKEGTFLYSTNINSVVISKYVESIGYGAFADCYNLKSVIIPKSVKYINKYAFYNCSLLKKAIVPQELENNIKENEVFPKNTKIIYK